MKHLFLLATVTMITVKCLLPVFIAAVVRETYSFIKIMQPLSPNYNWENGVKQTKITEENLSQLNLVKVLARPYLMTLFVIFSIHVNFPITSWCVLKAIHKKTVNCFTLLEKVFYQKDAFMKLTLLRMLHLINASILSWSVPIFHVSLSSIYQLFLR